MSRRRLRVLVLVHEELMPPSDTSVYDVRHVDWKMEFDVIETLQYIGHEVEAVGLSDDLFALPRAIDRFRPDVLFNLLEDFHDVAVNDQHWASFLELSRVPYTGCNPRGLLLGRDKALSKGILAYHGVPVPGFAVARRGERFARTPGLGFPLIVKSLVFDGSVGISQSSVVETEGRLQDRVRFIHRSVGSDAIVEEFIQGRELYVGVIGNDRLRAFPVWELRFKNRPGSTRLIATERVKWSDRYQRKVGVRTSRARLPAAKARSIQAQARRIFRLLEMSGYGRIDFRLAEDGTLYFLEANPNPQLAYGEDFAESADRAGVSYESLLQRVLNLALERRRS